MPDPEEVRTALARLATDAAALPGTAPRTVPPAAASPGGTDPRERTESTGASPSRTDAPLPPDSAATVVDVAAGAAADLDAAAAFAAAGGPDLLADAVEAADEAGDEAVARRGQRALAAFEWVRHAARPPVSDGDSHDRVAHDGDADPDDADTDDREEADADDGQASSAPTTFTPVTEPL